MKLKIWELALFTALTLTLLWGVLLDQRQQELESRLVRFHVLANTDSPADQALKLYVRDRVWADIRDLLQGSVCSVQAQAEIEEHLDRITDAARQAVSDWGGSHPVRATLIRERYPTRAYESFTLPAGVYSSLRVEIGAAQGENWWCVIFPPLCIQAAAGTPEALEASGFTADEIALISGVEDSYTVRFRALEIIDGIRSFIGQSG